MLNITSYVSLNDEETNRKKSAGGLLYEIIEYTHKNLHDLYNLCYKLTHILYIVYSIHMVCTYCSWSHDEYNNVRLFSARKNDVTEKCS